MFKQTFKNIDDILHKDAGCNAGRNGGEYYTPRRPLIGAMIKVIAPKIGERIYDDGGEFSAQVQQCHF